MKCQVGAQRAINLKGRLEASIDSSRMRLRAADLNSRHSLEKTVPLAHPQHETSSQLPSATKLAAAAVAAATAADAALLGLL